MCLENFSPSVQYEFEIRLFLRRHVRIRRFHCLSRQKSATNQHQQDGTNEFQSGNRHAVLPSKVEKIGEFYDKGSFHQHTILSIASIIVNEVQIA
jgi:hypothetical protein